MYHVNHGSKTGVKGTLFLPSSACGRPLFGFPVKRYRNIITQCSFIYNLMSRKRIEKCDILSISDSFLKQEYGAIGTGAIK